MGIRYKVVVISLFFACIACTSKKAKSDSTTSAITYNEVLKICDKRVQREPVPEVIKYVDSFYATINGGSIEAQIERYDFFCNVYNNGTHEYAKACLYADSMLQLIRKSKDQKFVSSHELIANYNMGDAYFNLKKYNEAFKYYYRAKTLAASTVDSFTLQDYNYRLGMVTYRQQHYDAANSYFKTSLRQISYGPRNFSTFLRKQELINNTALTFFKMNEYDSALLYYRNGLEYLDANKDLAGERKFDEIAKGVIYGNMGQVYIAQKQFDLAENALLKSISINSQKGYENRDAQFAQISLGNLYLQKNETQKLPPLINDLTISLGTTPNEEAGLRLNELSYKYYNQVNQPTAALKSLQSLIQMKDSLAQKNSNFLTTDVDELLRSVENQYNMDLLQKNNDIQKLYTVIAVAILMMVVAIIVFVIKNYKKSQRNIVALTALNAKIEDKKEKLHEALAKLELESKSKDHILKIVAHDLRNPLHGINGLTSILLSESEITPYQKHVLSLVQSSCNDANQLISEILEVAGLSEVKKLQKQPTNINTVLTQAVELLQTKAAEKNQQIVLDVPAKEEEVFINREKMSRVISNLITNSIKFSPANESIHVSAQSKNEGVIISVKDKGIGIPAELAESVFQTFTPAKRAGTSGEKSFGLGLSICRQIVEAHDGKIWFESEPGNGTTFHVQLN